MSDPKKKDEESWGAAPPRNPNEQSKASGIVFFQGSGQPLPEADSRDDFVRFACERVLQDFNLDPADIARGIIPDSRKKPFAAAYFLAQGVMVASEQEAERLAEAGEGARLDLILLQATRESEFNLDRLWRIRKTAQGLLAPEERELPVAMDQPGILHDTFRWFRRVSKALGDDTPRTVVRYVYVSRGDASNIPADLQNEADGILAMTRRSVPALAGVKFDFIAERELIV